jgi:cysteinyl-tRNA synthetase
MTNLALPFSLYDTYQKNITIYSETTTRNIGEIRLYSCGPTVYGYQSIGNMRAVWLPDTITKLATIIGWKVKWCLNITDVGHLTSDGDSGDDKIEKAARKSGRLVSEIVEHYTKDYEKQCAALRYNLPTQKMRPYASEYITEQMLIALLLCKNNLAYIQEDGIYFDYQEFSERTALVALLPNSIQKALITDSKNTKTQRSTEHGGRDPRDFALWKWVEETTLQKWKIEDNNAAHSLILQSDIDKDIITKWGCPGWHSECVAMICAVLEGAFVPEDVGPIIDIHTGGEDHIDIHHRNEILQSLGLGFVLSRTWVHNKFVLVDNTKMSKSLANVILVLTADDSEFDSIQKHNIDPLAYRLMLHRHSYREQLNFTWDKLRQYQSELLSMRKQAAALASYALTHEQYPATINPAEAPWIRYLTGDLDIPQMLTEYSNALSSTLTDAIAGKFDNIMFAYLAYWDREFLQLDLFITVPADILDAALERERAKAEKIFYQADRIRDDLLLQGWILDDYSWGTGIWKTVTFN